MIWAYLELKAKMVAGDILEIILPKFPVAIRVRIRKMYMDWIIPAPAQQTMLLFNFCPTCRCRTCPQRRHCVRGCGDCKLSWANYQDMRTMEAAYTFDKCQRFKGGQENDRN